MIEIVIFEVGNRNKSELCCNLASRDVGGGRWCDNYEILKPVPPVLLRYMNNGSYIMYTKKAYVYVH